MKDRAFTTSLCLVSTVHLEYHLSPGNLTSGGSEQPEALVRVLYNIVASSGTDKPTVGGCIRLDSAWSSLKHACKLHALDSTERLRISVHHLANCA